MDRQRATVLGVGGDNGNASWSTPFEGAIVAGVSDDATDRAVLENIRAAGYGE